MTVTQALTYLAEAIAIPVGFLFAVFALWLCLGSFSDWVGRFKVRRLRMWCPYHDGLTQLVPSPYDTHVLMCKQGDRSIGRIDA